uniref:Immunoglobulin domain-containing protein n=1 Tax=Naja naja TaxID=35670 RepID=A0A8C6XCX6_NAJNA
MKYVSQSKLALHPPQRYLPFFSICSPPFSPYCGLFFFYTDTTTFINVMNTRFIAARGGARISLHCSFGSLASWYKETEQDNHQEIMNSSRIHVTRNTSVVKMQINKLQHTDNGIYYCKSQDLSKPSCGTELKVMGIRTFEQVQSHHNMKDAIILIQTILLVLFVSLPVFLTQGKVSDWKVG